MKKLLLTPLLLLLLAVTASAQPTRPRASRVEAGTTWRYDGPVKGDIWIDTTTDPAVFKVSVADGVWAAAVFQGSTITIVDGGGSVTVDSTVLDAIQAALADTVSTNNSRTGSLNYAATWTGGADDLAGYSGVAVSVILSDPEPFSAQAITAQFSADGTNWGLTEAYPIQGGKVDFASPARARYFRLTLTNNDSEESAWASAVVRAVLLKRLQQPALWLGRAEVGVVDPAGARVSPATAGHQSTANSTLSTIDMKLGGSLTTQPVAGTANGATACYLTSAASTNATSCKASAGLLYGVEVVSTGSTLGYLRLYNLSSSPTCSSATGFVRTIPVPHGSGAGAGVANFYTVGETYSAGIGFCFTGGGSSTDSSNAPTGTYITLHFK